MMPQMGPGMMGGMGPSLLFWWIVLTTVVVLLLISACTWLVVNWLKNQRMARMQAAPQPHDDAYTAYEQGYQPQQPAETETYQEGGQRYSYPQLQYEQPQVQYNKQ